MKRAIVLALAVLVLAPAMPANAAVSFSLLSHSQYGPDADGYVHIVGEVQNTGSSSANFVQIDLDYYGTGGALLTGTYTYATSGILGPGARSPFHHVFVPPPGYASYTATVSGEPTSQQPNRNFGVVVTGTSSATGSEHVVGQVTNNNTTTANLIQVISTFYGADGTVVDAEYAYVATSVGALAPGATGTFDIARGVGAPAYSTRTVYADSETAPSGTSGAPTNPTSPSPSPTLPSPSPSEPTSPTPEQPVIERTASLSLRRHLVARGEVVAGGLAACLSQVTVKIQRKRPSGWRTVSTATTTLEGVFRKRVPDRRGRYRAVATKILTSELVCSRAISPIRRHRHS